MCFRLLHNGALLLLVRYIPSLAGQLLSDGLKSNFKVLLQYWLERLGGVKPLKPNCEWLSYGSNFNTGPPVPEYDEGGSSRFIDMVVLYTVSQPRKQS
jgi:hypothetical protein